MKRHQSENVSSSATKEWRSTFKVFGRQNIRRTGLRNPVYPNELDDPSSSIRKCSTEITLDPLSTVRVSISPQSASAMQSTICVVQRRSPPDSSAEKCSCAGPIETIPFDSLIVAPTHQSTFSECHHPHLECPFRKLDGAFRFRNLAWTSLVEHLPEFRVERKDVGSGVGRRLWEIEHAHLSKEPNWRLSRGCPGAIQLPGLLPSSSFAGRDIRLVRLVAQNNDFAVS